MEPCCAEYQAEAVVMVVCPQLCQSPALARCQLPVCYPALCSFEFVSFHSISMCSAFVRQRRRRLFAKAAVLRWCEWKEATNVRCGRLKIRHNQLQCHR